MWNQSLTAFNHDELIQAIPELSDLRQVVEHNDWHTNDVLQQSLDLFEWVKRLPGSLPTEIEMPEVVVQDRLATVVDPHEGHQYTVRQLLAFAALIHDVGKTKSFQPLPDGTTRCPGHEKEGALMTPEICARFDFTPAEVGLITTLVGAHGEPYALFKEIAAFPTAQQLQRTADFQVRHANHVPPLLLLAYGDLVTSDLAANKPHKYAAVLDFYRRWMRRALRKEQEQ